MANVNSTIAKTLVACGMAVAVSLAWAGPEEDYKTGAKMYGVGDMLGAMPFVKKAADAGHAGAQAMYAEILVAGDSGDQEALTYFTKSAQQGNADGQFGLGAMLASGEGGVKRDINEGRKWITKAAEQKHPAAINELALAYIGGGLGIAEEERKGDQALRWIRQSAENNFLPAMRELIKAYREGGYGLKADAKLAEQWVARERKVVGEQPGKRKRFRDRFSSGDSK